LASFVILTLLKMGLFDRLTEIYYLTSIPVRISLGEVILIVGATMTVVLISSIFPAYRGANLTPVEALKYE
jgi:lipoprotein-releasing system permease protein